MKKKFALGIALAAMLATGTAFAGDFGIGVHGGFGFANGGGLNLAFSNVFVYIDALSISSNSMSLGGAVDFVSFVDKEIADTLSWYIRMGVGAGLWGWDDEFAFAAGVRLPIGLSWRPVNMLELFIQAVPQVGLQVVPKFGLWNNFFGGNIGIRLWL
jgi:hypothetical protein